MGFDDVFARVKLTASSLSSTVKAVLANVRGFVTDPDDSTALEASDGESVWGVAGVICRPRASDDAGTCEGYAIRTDDGFTPIATRDLRINARVNPIDGEIDIAHYDGGFISLRDSSDGPKKGTQIVVLAPALKDDGSVDKSHTIILDPSAGNSSVTILHALGNGLSLTKDGNAILMGKGGTNFISVGASEILFNGVLSLYGGVVAGDRTQAQPVALAPAVTAFAQAVNDAVLDCQAGGSISPAHLTALATAIAALATTGTATTLKASPV